MRLALIGYGKMGKRVEAIASERGHLISVRCKEVSEIAFEAVRDADVCIDFSHPDVVLKNIQTLTSWKKHVVVGTTGWYEHLDTAREWVAQAQTGLIYGPNFSLGIQLFLQIIKQSARLMGAFQDYDVALFEEHHRHKADAPSGTAKECAQILADTFASPPISSIRCGSIPGTHTVIFDSPVDTITLSHQARNRDGFALGALYAAEFIANKTGFYHFSESIQEKLYAT